MLYLVWLVKAYLKSNYQTIKQFQIKKFVCPAWMERSTSRLRVVIFQCKEVFNNCQNISSVETVQIKELTCLPHSNDQSKPFTPITSNFEPTKISHSVQLYMRFHWSLWISCTYFTNHFLFSLEPMNLTLVPFFTQDWMKFRERGHFWSPRKKKK